jgi:hypothetical protein
MALTKTTYSMIDGATVNAVDYGAVADWNGSTGTDNTTAFTNAINALAAKGGGVLLIPPGDYKGRLLINHSNIHIVGYGATVGFGAWETLTISAIGGATNLGPFLAFPPASNVPIDPAPNAVFYDIVLATQGSRTVEVTDASGIAAGDYCMMISGTSVIATPNTNYVPETSQIKKVIGVSGNNVWFDEPNDVTITSLAEHPYLIKWDFATNIKLEGLTINNFFGAAYCVSFGGVVGLTLEKVTFEPTSAWGAFSACRDVRIDNCTVKNAYNGFSSARMCDDVVFIGCTVSCTDTNLSTSENYFYFGEENQKNVKIIGCRGVDAGVFFYGGNGWTNIQISDSVFDVLKTGKSAFRLTTFDTGALVTCTNSTFVSRGGVSQYPWDVEPNGTVEVAFLSGDVLFTGCTIRQAGVGIEVGNQYFGTDNVKRIDPIISEKGTWTPTIFGATTAGSTTYTQQDGAYARENNVVTVSFEVAWSAASGTGNVRLGGLPFISSADNFGVEIVFTGTVQIADAVGFRVQSLNNTAFGYVTITGTGRLSGTLTYIV